MVRWALPGGVSGVGPHVGAGAAAIEEGNGTISELGQLGRTIASWLPQVLAEKPCCPRGWRGAARPQGPEPFMRRCGFAVQQCSRRIGSG